MLFKGYKKQRDNGSCLAANLFFHFTSFKSIVALLYFSGKPNLDFGTVF